MNYRKIFFLSVLAAAIAFTPTSSLADDFDLDSQRGEVQEFKSVPGKKLDHKGLIINPTPQKIEHPYTGVLNASGGFSVKDKRKAFADDLEFLKQAPKGLPLTIDFGEKQAKKAGVQPTDGAYQLEIGEKGVKITGFNERGAYYGLQTLRQILESPVSRGGMELPMMVVNDWPSMKYRGVVEGFYGEPWSHKVRMSLIDFYGRNKLNNYIYGPKDDPYHSSPYWRLPYPPEPEKNIRELVKAAKKNRVDFVWAIHPGKDIRWNKEDYDSLVGKFNMMYDLGVRSFAIFFDDIEGEGTNPAKQVELLNNLTNDFVKAKGDVSNLMICPTDYSQLWAKPGPDGPLAVYGRDLNPNVEVFWTGAVVCSDLTPETLEFVDSRIRRPALYWWNYPVTDYCRHILMQGPVYGLDTSLTSDQVAGIESNPMEHGEASKLALYGVADYSWNTTAYNPIDNWERGLAALVPEAPEAYRNFAIHSTDTETGYRRDESWETVIFPYNDYTPQQFETLKKELEAVRGAEAILLEKANPALVKEIAPWLAQLTKVSQRALNTLDLIKIHEQGNDSLFWTAYVANVMTAADKKAFEAHKVGTMKLHPFYENNMQGMVTDFFEKVSGTKPALYKGVGTYPNLRTTQAQLMLDNDSTTFYTSAASQGPGHWIGLDLLEVKPVHEVLVHQGRNSVDDVDYFDNVQLEYSIDGSGWKPLTEALPRTYIVEWSGEPVRARYIRLKRLDSERQNWASVRSFSVNPPKADRIGLNITSIDPEAALLAFDSNPTSVFNTVGDLGFDRRPEAKRLVILLAGKSSPLKVVQYDLKGREVAAATVSSAYSTVEINPETARFVVSGNAPVCEIVQK